jgi:hypothetical protein
MSPPKDRRLRPPSNSPAAPTDSPSDYTADDAPGRYFRFRVPGFTYGTDDKFQGAAILVLCFVGVFWISSAVAQYFISTVSFLATVNPLLGTIVPVIIGVIIGRAAPR